MKNSTPWTLIAGSLEKDIPVMLLYVLESKGSSPGRQGFFMAVNAAGEMEGSIGGGIMEHKLVEMAKERLKGENREAVVRKQMHDKAASADQSGMICSGEQTIWLYPVKKEEAGAIIQLVHSFTENRNGTLCLSPQGIAFDPSLPIKNFDLQFESAEQWVYKEKTGYRNNLFIIGGGHCSLALSRLLQSIGFYVSVYDDRDGLNTLQKNEWAHEKHILTDYTLLGDLIPAGPDNYVVIMTVGYRTDDLAIKALLDKKFKYLGVLGSQKKMETLFDGYRKEGIPEEWLQRIHTPVGLAINSQTPEEIAVSIAAEIIMVKNSVASPVY